MSEGPSDEAIDLAHRLLDAARAGETAILDAYIEAGVPVDLTDAKGDSLLMLAAYNGHAETVRHLLERGAEPDRPNDKGQTPLAGAVFKAYPDVVEALLDAGADPSVGTPSPIQTAAMFEATEIMALLERTHDH